MAVGVFLMELLILTCSTVSCCSPSPAETMTGEMLACLRSMVSPWMFRASLWFYSVTEESSSSRGW